MVLLLFESPAGHALFKVLDEGKLKEAETKVRGLGSRGRSVAVALRTGDFGQCWRLCAGA